MSTKISNKQLIIVVVLAAVCLVAGFAVGWQFAPQRSAEQVTLPPIKLGSVAPLTGAFASSGQEMHRGLEMAVQEINAQGGVLGRQVQVIEVDIEDMSPDKIVSAFESLCSKDQVDFIVYGWTVVYGPQWDVCAEYGVPVLHVETVKDFVDWGNAHPNDLWLNFQATPPDTYYGVGFAVFIDNLIKQGSWTPINKKMALIRGEDAYGQRIIEVFKSEMTQRGWTATVDETVTFGTVEYTPLLSKIRADPPAVIVNTDLVASDLAAFMKQFRENPTSSLFLTVYGAGAPEFIELGQNDVEGVIWSTVMVRLRDEYGEAWAQKYRTKYGEDPGDDAAFLYDMTHIWATATALAGTTEPRKVTAQMEKIIYRGLTGTIRFNEEHWAPPYPDAVDDPSMGLPHVFLQIQNQANKVIYPTPYNTTNFQLPPWI